MIKKYQVLFVVLALNSLVQCAREKKSESYFFVEDFQISTDFLPRAGFMGLCSAGGEGELIYLAEPKTQKRIHFKDFNDQLLYTVPLDSAYNYLDKIYGVNVITLDSICLLSEKGMLVIDRGGDKVAFVGLEEKIEGEYEFHPISSQINPAFSRYNNSFLIGYQYPAEELDSITTREGVYGKTLFVNKKELANYHSVLLNSGDGSLDFIGKNFYKRFSNVPFYMAELRGLYSIGDTSLITTHFSKQLYIYSSQKNRIIDSIKIETDSDYFVQPIIQVTKENIDNAFEIINDNKKGMIRKVLCNQNKSKYFLIVYHGKNRGQKKDPYTRSIVILDKSFQEINEFFFEPEGYIFSNALYSNEKGLLIPKLDETKTKFIFHRFVSNDNI